MNIHLEEDSSLPIYEQIVLSIKKAVLNGGLCQGDLLPSIRSLAKDLGISVITTKRAYEELEKQGVIYSRQGKGFYIRKPDVSALKTESLEQLKNNLRSCIRNSRECDLSLEEFQEMAAKLWDTIPENDRKTLKRK